VFWAFGLSLLLLLITGFMFWRPWFFTAAPGGTDGGGTDGASIATAAPLVAPFAPAGALSAAGTLGVVDVLGALGAARFAGTVVAVGVAVALGAAGTFGVALGAAGVVVALGAVATVGDFGPPTMAFGLAAGALGALGAGVATAPSAEALVLAVGSTGFSSEVPTTALVDDGALVTAPSAVAPLAAVLTTATLSGALPGALPEALSAAAGRVLGANGAAIALPAIAPVTPRGTTMPWDASFLVGVG
jgi:hypothetical protein